LHPEMLAWAEGRAPILRVERFGVTLMRVYAAR